jgi:hypothetical protein
VTELVNSLVESIQPHLVTASQSREVVLWGGTALGAVAFAQLVFVLWTIWRLREIGRLRERLSRLADGLALLTDTTESGFASIGAQLEALAAARTAAPRAATRMHVAKRVVAAALKGEKVAHIARNEAMSESEVRLHLSLAQGKERKARGALAGEVR